MKGGRKIACWQQTLGVESTQGLARVRYVGDADDSQKATGSLSAK